MYRIYKVVDNCLIKTSYASNDKKLIRKIRGNISHGHTEFVVRCEK
ncbi:unknown [Clostridium sp. CAG:221]|nr:hypothetical protein [Clostridium sp. CAG:221]CDB14654.1 unknown [Clostridium sp. CAG:221]